MAPQKRGRRRSRCIRPRVTIARVQKYSPILNTAGILITTAIAIAKALWSLGSNSAT
jgi:hypothetical protein